MKRIAAALAFLAAAAASAQPRTTEAQARIYVWSALMTGAAHAIVSPDVELAAPLREKLALSSQADRDTIYEALVTLTRGRLIRVRAATEEEAAPLAGHADGQPVFLVEGAASPLLVAYDLQRDQVSAIGALGMAWTAPEPAPEPPVKVTVLAPIPTDVPSTPFLLKPVFFAYRDATLSEQAITTLENQGLAKIAATAGVQYVVRGHSDRLEDEQYQHELSQERAAAVREYLAGRGVAPENIRLMSFGASISLTACAQRDREVLISCLAPDRRVTVEILPPPM